MKKFLFFTGVLCFFTANGQNFVTIDGDAAQFSKTFVLSADNRLDEVDVWWRNSIPSTERDQWFAFSDHGADSLNLRYEEGNHRISGRLSQKGKVLEFGFATPQWRPTMNGRRPERLQTDGAGNFTAVWRVKSHETTYFLRAYWQEVGGEYLVSDLDPNRQAVTWGWEKL